MSDKRLLKWNPTLNSAVYMHEDDENIVIETVRDETNLYDENNKLRNEVTSLDRWGDGRVALRGVPPALIEKWKREGNFTKERFYKVMLSEEAQPYKVFG